ncbi:hypothetical protein Tco_0569487 [Tanacetum coccineum]
MLQFKIQKVLDTSSLPIIGKKAIGTKVGEYDIKNTESGIILSTIMPQKVPDEFMGELTVFLGLPFKEKEEGIYSLVRTNKCGENH